ncbi:MULTISPECIES: DUF2213 domain-containing protein [unclassified Rhizobium]|jgi:hypothetical protein|uniref:DUF2213 domain-containing protein n=1 Tax=unclassified Rhizobium TaxID=2613769 RepID=UPI0006488FB9|nr:MULTISPECIES: DUF2213 domain-containing protein [unclassified Rhizobium]MBN8951440.1 DUF2213 domain-containing protein [Rhizobium tropici]OJY74748.1 MAG: hypothetical protein BGP09_33480 [Rhizobium sp. 60-20]RKD66744.1 hypothetical protein BJ928_106272 [Rhizobium sp. WW_1]
MNFTDTVTVAGTRRTGDGYLVADARIARTGIQNYAGAEIGRPEMPTVRIYRPGGEVFSEDTLKSAAHRPVTNEHPPEMVTSENWKKYAVGQTGDEIAGEGIFLRVPLMVSDEDAIQDIESGKQELSAGYVCDVDFTAGVTPSGEAYDAIQRNIRINHIAIVRRGRAGSKVRIGDAAAPWGCSPLAAPRPFSDDKQNKEGMMPTKTIMIDGIEIEVSDQAAEIITTLRQRLVDAEAGHQKAIAIRDAELDTLKSALLDEAEIERRAQARADLIGLAKAIADNVQTSGLSDAAIRKAVVIAKAGEGAVEGRADAYIDARFDMLAEGLRRKPDLFAEAIKDGINPTQSSGSPAFAAYAAMVRDLESAHLAANPS